MIQIDKEKVSKALNDAYLEAGDNAYYGTGFRDGIKFALAEVEKLNIHDVSRRCLLESILEDMKSTHCEYHQEIVEGYLHNDC